MAGILRRWGILAILTIGAYGWTEATFFTALQSAGVRTFCDIRRRRGVRGHEYAFANAGRLQARLTELGIGYVHRLDLAPSDVLRQAQARADAEHHTARRSRGELTPEFTAAFGTRSSPASPRGTSSTSSPAAIRWCSSASSGHRRRAIAVSSPRRSPTPARDRQPPHA